MERRRLTKAAVRLLVDELVRRANVERLSVQGQPAGEGRGHALGRASGFADAAMLLSAGFDLGAAATLEGGVLAKCPTCGYVFCRCASCGKPNCRPDGAE